MRICTNCGHELGVSEKVCSVCGSDLILDTAGESENRITEVTDTVSAAAEQDAENIFVDFSPAETDGSASGPSDTATEEEVSVPSENTLAEETEAPPVLEKTGGEPDPAPAEQSGSSDDKIKVIKVKVRGDRKLRSFITGRVAAAVLTLLLVVCVISAVVMIAVPLVQSRRQDEAAKEQAYMDFLTGEWLSETFIYSGMEYPSCEILRIGKDSSFVSEIRTSPNDRETFDPETWTVTATQSGDLHLELETSSLRVSYTDSDGNTMVYRRYILKLDTGSLVLREYYNEKMTDYYDVVFTRYGG